jgi:hypothetical protein
LPDRLSGIIRSRFLRKTQAILPALLKQKPPDAFVGKLEDIMRRADA